MTALQHGRDAAGTGQADLERIGLDLIRRCPVVGVGQPVPHRLAQWAVPFLPRPLLEIAAIGRFCIGWKRCSRSAFKRIGEIVNRIVRAAGANCGRPDYGW